MALAGFGSLDEDDDNVNDCDRDKADQQVFQPSKAIIQMELKIQAKEEEEWKAKRESEESVLLELLRSLKMSRGRAQARYFLSQLAKELKEQRKIRPMLGLGLPIDLCDTQGSWRSALVIDVEADRFGVIRKVRVHIEGFGSDIDETLDANSPRIAPAGLHTHGYWTGFGTRGSPDHPEAPGMQLSAHAATTSSSSISDKDTNCCSSSTGGGGGYLSPSKKRKIALVEGALSGMKRIVNDYADYSNEIRGWRFSERTDPFKNMGNDYFFFSASALSAAYASGAMYFQRYAWAILCWIIPEERDFEDIVQPCLVKSRHDEEFKEKKLDIIQKKKTEEMEALISHYDQQQQEQQQQQQHLSPAAAAAAAAAAGVGEEYSGSGCGDGHGHGHHHNSHHHQPIFAEKTKGGERKQDLLEEEEEEEETTISVPLLVWCRVCVFLGPFELRVLATTCKDICHEVQPYAWEQHLKTQYPFHYRFMPIDARTRQLFRRAVSHTVLYRRRAPRCTIKQHGESNDTPHEFKENEEMCWERSPSGKLRRIPISQKSGTKKKSCQIS